MGSAYVGWCMLLLIRTSLGGISAMSSLQLAKPESVTPLAATLMLFWTTAIAAKRDLTSNDEILPKQVFTGEEAHMSCGDAKNVEWLYQRNELEERAYIISGGNLTNGDRGGRLRISGRMLIISNVTTSDQGIYTCRVKSFGLMKEHRILLTVYDQKVVSEKTITALIGGKVTMPCRTALNIPVDWYYLRSKHEKGAIICVAGNIRNGFTERFRLDRSSFGDYSLVIRNVTRGDKGIYICRENAGVGVEHRLTLNVYEKSHTSTSNQINEFKFVIPLLVGIIAGIFATIITCIWCCFKCNPYPIRAISQWNGMELGRRERADILGEILPAKEQYDYPR